MGGGGAVDIRVDGDRLRILQKEIARLGPDRELKKAMLKGLNRATKPLRERALANADTVLPQRGGLAGRVATGKMGKLNVTTSKGGVAVVGGRRRQLGLMDRGQVVHPVFMSKRRMKAAKSAGRKVRRVTQELTPGWFTKPMEAGAPEARKAVIKELDNVARQVARRIGN